MATKEEFMFQNVAYRPTVYKTGGMAINKFSMSVCMLRVKLAGIGLQMKNYPYTLDACHGVFCAS